MQHRSLVALAIAFTTGGCFATRNDVRILQSDLMTARAEAARADSVNARRLQEIMNTLSGALTTLNDSVREASARLGRFQGETRTELRSVNEQLIMIQELTGQSQRTIAALRAATEERTQAMMSSAPPVVGTAGAPGDTTARAATTSAPPEGPYQLWQMADDQMRRGSPATARTILQQLLTTYPNEPELAPQASLRISETYDREGKFAQADSGYREVVAKYPRSKQAATASYKRALVLERQGKCAEAMTQIDQLRRLFPLSDEVELAKDYRCPRQ